MEASDNEYILQRKNKLQHLRDRNINPYPYSFNVTHTSEDLHATHKHLKHEEKTRKSVNIAGRIMTLRVMGKAGFAHLQDHTGRIQIYVKEDEVGPQEYTIFSKSDLGDIVGVEGVVFKTKKGELSIWVKHFTLLCKSIRPLPEKWHGLKDIEQRYRKRELDLISNPDTKKIFVTRSNIITAMRAFLDSKGFLEVETPILQKMYGGANARPFKSKLHDLNMDVYLRISDELYLKRLIIGGFNKVYEIGKDFRNESIDRTHNPEFTMMECYQAYADYEDIMKLTEDMWEYITKKVLGTTKITYQGKKLDLKAPWKRMTMIDALKKNANINITQETDEGLQQLLKNYNIEYEGGFTRGLAIQLLFEELVEDKLTGPIFITDHPKESTPLCKEKRGNPELIERFEPFICGMEVANAYSELNDPVKQRQLLEAQQAALRAGSTDAHPADEDFLYAIEVGMPPTGGLGVGIDRMVMILTDSPSIRDVIFFPFMKD